MELQNTPLQLYHLLTYVEKASKNKQHSRKEVCVKCFDKEKHLIHLIRNVALMCFSLFYSYNHYLTWYTCYICQVNGRTFGTLKEILGLED